MDGALSIGCYRVFAPYMVPALVARMTKLHPDINLTLVEADQEHLITGLRRSDIEVALLYDFGLGPELCAERLAELTPYVLLAEGHPLAGASGIALQDLQSEPLILLDIEPSGSYFCRYFGTPGWSRRSACAPSPWKWCVASWGMVWAMACWQPSRPAT